MLISKMAKEETVPSRHYRARRRKTLSLDEQQQIVKAYMEGQLPQKEVARRFRVTV